MKDYFHEYMKLIRNPLPEMKRTFEAEIEYLNASLENAKNALDIGCGAGRTLIELAKTNPYKLLIGIDNDQRMIEAAKEETRKHPNIYISKQDALQIAFSDKKFDLVYSSYNTLGVVEKEDREQIIREKYRLSKEKGKIITMTWNRDEFTTEFLNELYEAVGSIIYSIDENKSILNVGTAERIHPDELSESYENLRIKNIKTKKVGKLWIAVEGEK